MIPCMFRQPRGVVHILVPRQATVHRPPQQVGEGTLRIVHRAGASQVLSDEFSEAFFQRLPSRSIEAGELGIYVCIQLFLPGASEKRGGG